MGLGSVARRWRHAIVLIVGLSLSAGCDGDGGLRPVPLEGSRPNFVIIFTDDQGYGDVGAYGATDLDTPNLDRMAADGIRFTSFYVSTSVCSPSRAALLTGMYPQRVGIPRVLMPQDEVGLDPDELTIAELLKTQGYATGAFGKWHLGHRPRDLPPNHGFDEYFGLPYSNDMTPDAAKNPNPPARRHPPLPLIDQLDVVELEPDQTQLTRRYTERATAFIERNKDRPFFVYVPHSMPHTPLFVSERFAGTSRRGVYGDVIKELDWSVGEILATLDRLGLDDRTLVVFLSDNGPWLVKGDHGGSAGPFREGKATAFEGGFRVPAIARWPGRIPARRVSDALVTAMDLMPTFAGLAGAALPADRVLDGRDIWPILSGQSAASPHEVFYYVLDREVRAVRAGRWKLMLPQSYDSILGAALRTDTFQGTYARADIELSLFDLETDLGETADVSSRHPDVVERLLAAADAARRDLGGLPTAGARVPRDP